MSRLKEWLWPYVSAASPAVSPITMDVIVYCDSRANSGPAITGGVHIYTDTIVLKGGDNTITLSKAGIEINGVIKINEKETS